MSRLGAEPIFDSYWAALAMGGVLALLLLVRPQFGLVTPARQLTFLGLRLAAIGLLLLGLIRPTWITTVRTPRTSVLVMLVDGSRSMQLPSGQGSLSRWHAQGETLSRSQAALAALGEKVELRTYAYDSQLTPLAVSGGRIALPEKPTGEETDLGTILSAAQSPPPITFPARAMAMRVAPFLINELK